MDMLDTLTPMDTLDTMENVKLSLKLILLISTVDCMDIMDMLDIHTPMDIWDIMESVKLSLRLSLKLILLISMVDCTEIMHMLDIPTHMDTWDTMESVKLKPILLIYMEASMDTMAMLAIPTHMDTSDTMDKHQHHQMNLPQKMDTSHSLLFSSVTALVSVLNVLLVIKSRKHGGFILCNCNNKLSSAFQLSQIIHSLILIHNKYTQVT